MRQRQQSSSCYPAPRSFDTIANGKQWLSVSSPSVEMLWQRSIGNQGMRALLSSGTIQASLKLGQPNDRYEQEANRVATQIVAIQPSVDTNGLTTIQQAQPNAIQRTCASCSKEYEDAAQQYRPVSVNHLCPKCRVQTKPLSGQISTLSHGRSQQAETWVAPSIARDIRSLQRGGSPLSSAERQYFEPRFGVNFGQVRVHTGARAGQLADTIQAKSFTLGSDIVFARGQYQPNSREGKQLMAHELTHVVQQSHTAHGGQSVVQRKVTTLEGFDDACYALEDRDLRTGGGVLDPTQTPGGEVQPGTAGAYQNCAGASLCGRAEYINWPFLGREVPNPVLSNWDRARYFVPTGCSPVSCSGISVSSTRCAASEREVIVFLYRWPVGRVRGTTMTVYQSDFHMIGRTLSSLPMAWESKMDRRERVTDIRDPRQSLYDAYPHTRLPNREIVQLCFCCNCGDIRTS